MSPHPDDLHSFNVVEDLVDEPMLDVDAAGKGAVEITDEFLVRRRVLVWILT